MCEHGHAHHPEGVHPASHPAGPHESDDSDDSDESPSTGFLPISLALALFVTGLFVLGIIP